MKYGNVYKAIFERPWAILPSTLALMVEIYQFRASGGHLDTEEIQARVEAAKNGPRDQKGRRSGNSVAVIPVYGVLSPRAELFSQSSGGTAYESISRSLRAALADDEFGSILFDIDSPGGSVQGLEELAQEIRESRGIKPMTAISRYQMASAAYYLGSQADEVVVSPSGEAGSIGVIYAHEDLSGALEKEGVKTTLITHGKHKGEGNKFEPLTEEARAEIQAHANHYGAMFEKAVSLGRGIPVKTVQDNFGAGRMFTAENSVKAGLADRVEVFDDTISRLAHKATASVSAGQAKVALRAEPQSMTLYRTDFTSANLEGINDDIEAEAVAPLPFAERLVRVADEVEAIARHARDRAAMRAEEDRSLSSETREQLARLLALRPVLDEIEALAAEPTVPAPRVVRHQLDMLMAAYEKGYPVEDLVKGLTNE